VIYNDGKQHQSFNKMALVLFYFIAVVFNLFYLTFDEDESNRKMNIEPFSNVICGFVILSG
jgi:hypothetical protein